MENGFTPGPWLVQKEALPNRVGITAAGGQFITWAMSNHPNARLVAAAPDLLEALECVAKRIEASDEWWMDCPDRGGFDLTAIKAAIAKALSPTAKDTPHV